MAIEIAAVFYQLSYTVCTADIKEKGEDISYMTNEKVMILNEPSCRKIRISF